MRLGPIAVVSLIIGCAFAVGCAALAKPKAKPQVHVLRPTDPDFGPASRERVAESDLLRYRAAYLEFKAREEAILEKYKIRDGESFDPETGTIDRSLLKVPATEAPPPRAPAPKPMPKEVRR